MTCSENYKRKLTPAERIERAWEKSMQGIDDRCPPRYRERVLETLSRHASPF